MIDRSNCNELMSLSLRAREGLFVGDVAVGGNVVANSVVIHAHRSPCTTIRRFGADGLIEFNGRLIGLENSPFHSGAFGMMSVLDAVGEKSPA